MERIAAFLTNRHTLSYAAAFLLHVLLFGAYPALREVLVGVRWARTPRPEATPVAIEFVEVPDRPADQRPPAQTPLMSDRQLSARDRYDGALPQSHLPYSEGVVRTGRDFQTSAGGGAPRSGNGEEERRAAASGEHQGQTSGLPAAPDEFRQQRQEAVYGRPAVLPQALALDNRRSSALEKGGLQLSTYAWDFAPYLSYLKRRIEGHISPPPAFTQFGMIEGRTRLRFKILRDGTLRDLEVLGHEGSSLLRDTSERAVNLSAQFRELPHHFPDPYLEITGVFDYIVLRDFRSP